MCKVTGKLEVEQNSNPDLSPARLELWSLWKGKHFRRPVCCQPDDPTCSHPGWLGFQQKLLGPALPCALQSKLLLPGSHQTGAQPKRLRQSRQLTPLTVTLRSKPRKLPTSAYLSAFIKWNKLFLNTRVANSLRGN